MNIKCKSFTVFGHDKTKNLFYFSCRTTCNYVFKLCIHVQSINMTSDLFSLFYKLRNITKAKRLIWYAEELCKLSICMLIFDYKLRRSYHHQLFSILYPLRFIVKFHCLIRMSEQQVQCNNDMKFENNYFNVTLSDHTTSHRTLRRKKEEDRLR